MKFTAKSLERNAKKCLKDEKTEKLKLKKAIQAGNTEGAKIHAENAIRKKNESLNFMRMASRIDAVASRVQTAVSMQTLTKSMAGVVRSMDSAMKSMNLEKMSQVMEKFETQFEDLDVQSKTMESGMVGATSLSTPASEVNNLMQQVADEHGLELGEQMNEMSVGTKTAQASKADDLNERLAKLRNM